jgi:hypothetical protein
MKVFDYKFLRKIIFSPYGFVLFEFGHWVHNF